MKGSEDHVPPPALLATLERGSVLLEVVLALALFVGAATVISSGINASVQAVHRLRLDTHAANLAISVMSEMQMHARPIAPIGPEPFDPPFEEWSFAIRVTQGDESALEANSLRPVEVIITHSREHVVHRLTQLFRDSEIANAAASDASSEPAGGVP